MRKPGTTARAVLGVIGGVVWFATVSAAAVLQHTESTPGGSTGGAIALVVVISGLCVLGFRAWGAAWGWGVSSALAVCLLLGLIEGPLGPEGAAPQVISVPTSFSVGLGSLAVWVAFGVSLALSLSAQSQRGTGHARDGELAKVQGDYRAV